VKAEKDELAPVLVVVQGGVAEIVEGGHAAAILVDIDNIRAGDPPVDIPRGVGYEALVKKMRLDPSYIRWVVKPGKWGKKEMISYLRTVSKSCQEGYDGDWDCSTDEGKEGFLAMQECVERVISALKGR